MNNVINKFFEKHNASKEDIRVFHAPGRVNLIGEHIDYNGGNVFPAALEFGTYAVVSTRSDSKLKLNSLNMDLEVEVDLNDIFYDEADDWANYPKGALKMLQDEGHKLKGMNIMYEGNIPNGAGLSSSASIELVTLLAANEINNLGLELTKLAKLGQKTENEFMGVNSGMMDQYAVALGKKDHGILLDCETLEYQYAPLDLEGYKVVLTNTNKRRQLNESEYNTRREECDKALLALQEELDVKYLCNISTDEFNKYSYLLKDEVLKKRARHVITENERSLNATKALEAGDLELFGQLMNESHKSLKEDYEVTGVELDTLVNEAQQIDGVIGSRMTGAGFGGCTEVGS